LLTEHKRHARRSRTDRDWISGKPVDRELI
jgi:hypothetical protein